MDGMCCRSRPTAAPPAGNLNFCFTLIPYNAKQRDWQEQVTYLGKTAVVEAAAGQLHVLETGELAGPK